VSFGGAGGRLVELGEGKGRQEFVAASALLFRDGDGRLVIALPKPGVRGSTPFRDPNYFNDLRSSRLVSSRGCGPLDNILGNSGAVSRCPRKLSSGTALTAE
jgi:hypothetical protein